MMFFFSVSINIVGAIEQSQCFLMKNLNICMISFSFAALPLYVVCGRNAFSPLTALQKLWNREEMYTNKMFCRLRPPKTTLAFYRPKVCCNLLRHARFSIGGCGGSIVLLGTSEAVDRVRQLRAALGCSGLLWVTLGCSGLSWAALGCSGLFWTAVGFSGLLWATLACSGLP